MDRTIRTLLSIGVAILYPILIFFAVMTFIQRPDTTQRPTYPNCSRYEYDSFRGQRTVNFDCERQYDEYDHELKEYERARNADKEKNVTRAQVALGMALLTIVGALFLRDIKELMAGFITGAVVVVMVTISIIVGGSTEAVSVVNALLSLLSFIILAVVLFILDSSLPMSGEVGDSAKPAHMTEHPSASHDSGPGEVR